MKNILILGSEGFLGSVLVPYLQKEKKIQITGVDKCFFGINNKETKNFKFLKKDNFENFFILACTISLFLEMFPIRTSGSIFSTGNITYIVLISSFILRYRNAFK